MKFYTTRWNTKLDSRGADRCRLVCALLLLAWGCFQPRALLSQTHYVHPGQSIQQAIERAERGDTIVIAGGEYRENLRVTTRVTLIGRELPRIRGGFVGHTILILASGTVLDGLHVSESGLDLNNDIACIRVEADSVTIRNCLITKPLHGIYVKGGSYVDIHDNRIEGRLDLISEDRGNGIHLWNSQHNTLYRNEVFNTRDGIYFSFTDSTNVHHNYIHNVRYGLHYMYSNNNRFFSNLFEQNVAGAALMYSQYIVFHQNVFARCRGFHAYGLLYQSMDHTSATDNLIIDNSRGVFLNNANFSRFTHNDIVDNDIAIQLFSTGEENVFIANNNINNLSNLVVDSRKTRMVWAADSGGNYWSQYDGYDLDGDGVGDVPFKIQNVFQVIETRFPEIRFYLFSPAARILEIAERSLPVLQMGTEADPLPLMRPVDNTDVPWEKTHHLSRDSSPVLAVLYFLVGGIPVLFLLRISRRRRGK